MIKNPFENTQIPEQHLLYLQIGSLETYGSHGLVVNVSNSNTRETEAEVSKVQSQHSKTLSQKQNPPESYL
jgi:hypothetical protein